VRLSTRDAVEFVAQHSRRARPWRYDVNRQRRYRYHAYRGVYRHHAWRGVYRYHAWRGVYRYHATPESEHALQHAVIHIGISPWELSPSIRHHARVCQRCRRGYLFRPSDSACVPRVQRSGLLSSSRTIRCARTLCKSDQHHQVRNFIVEVDSGVQRACRRRRHWRASHTATCARCCGDGREEGQVGECHRLLHDISVVRLSARDAVGSLHGTARRVVCSPDGGEARFQDLGIR
jgi:hypothetical protein